jgi:hypothetical protein
MTVATYPKKVRTVARKEVTISSMTSILVGCQRRRSVLIRYATFVKSATVCGDVTFL